MEKILEKRAARLKRKKRVRKKILGTPERPRLTVFRSAKHVYAQIVDDTSGRTLASISTLIPEAGSGDVEGAKTGRAKLVGKLLAQRALSRGIGRVAFDANGYKYHGRVKALSEGAREGGLEF